MKQNRVSDGRIAAINFGAFFLYGLICYLINDAIAFSLIFVGHFFVAIILAIADRRWIWALSAFGILLIGFSTCVTWPASYH
jgi:hypothetical protein